MRMYFERGLEQFPRFSSQKKNWILFFEKQINGFSKFFFKLILFFFFFVAKYIDRPKLAKQKIEWT